MDAFPNTSSPYNTTEYYYGYGDNEANWVFLEDDESDTFGGVFSSILYCVIFTFSLAGNGLLFLALLKQEDLRKTSNIFLLNLTVSDLLFTLPLPFWAVYQFHHWVFGEAACKLFSGLFFLGLYSYMMFLVVLTMDRYTAVVRAVYFWRARRRLRTHLTYSIVWVFCITASIPEMLFSETRNSQNGTLCDSKEQTLEIQLLFVCMQITLFFILPFAVITFCYARIWASLLKSKSRKKHQAVKLILGIIVGFFICWAPYNIVLLLLSVKEQNHAGLASAEATAKLKYSYTIFHCLAYCHCCLNPFFHIFGAGKFRSYLSTASRRFRSQTFSSHSGVPKTSVSVNQTNV